MRILVVGAGALGGMIGACLTEAGEDVVLLERDLARVRLLNEEGLHLAEDHGAERWVRLNVVSDLLEQKPVELVFVSVKTYQTEGAIRGALPVINDNTFVLSVQNGLGSAATIAELVGPERVLTGITYHSVQHLGPNRLRFRRGVKPIQIAPFDGELRPEVKRIRDVFQAAGLDTQSSESIEVSTWQKLLHNAVINPVSALTGLTCHELLHDEEMQGFMRDLCDEIVAVMRAKNIPVSDEQDPYRPLLGSQRALGKNRPSMWQDLARGMRTEVDAINGAIVREAERLGLQAPHNKAITHFIHSRENQKFGRRRHEQVAQSEQPAAPPQMVRRSTGVAPDGGMAMGRVPLRCTGELKEIVREYYRDVAKAGADRSRKVAWVNGTGPVELLRAFGFALYFPENHAALIGATRQAGAYITRALAAGFSPFASSAMTADIGATLAGESPLRAAHGIDGPPLPDLAVYSTNFGHSLVHWFEYIGDRFSVPVLGLHPPAAIDELGETEYLVATQQFWRLIEQLQQHTGVTFDPDRVCEVVRLSAAAASLWRQVLDLACTVPSPLTFFDVLVHMAPIVMMRGTPQAIEYYRILKEELDERVQAGQAAVPNERFRFFWEGPPVWCALRPLAKLFLEHGVAIVGSTYGNMFRLDEFDPIAPIGSMARAYTSLFANRSDRAKATQLRTWLTQLGVDAVVYHDGRTNPELSNVRYGLARKIAHETNLPAMIFEADSHDPRLFSEQPLREQLSRFVEKANRQPSTPEAETSHLEVRP